jgi:hypothetical protein
VLELILDITGLALFIIVVLYLIGFPVHLLISESSGTKIFSNVMFVILSGITILVLASYYLAFLDADVNYLKYVLIIPIVAILYSSFNRTSGIRVIVFFVISLLSFIPPLFQFLPALYFSHLSGSTSGLSSYGNNDITYYLSVASKFVENGFVNDYSILNTDLGFAAAETQYFTPTALFAFYNVTFDLNFLKIGMPLLLISGSLVIISTIRLLVATFLKGALGLAVLISLIAFLNPLMFYVFSASFLTQIIATAIMTSFLAFIFEVFNNNHSAKRVVIESSVYSILSAFTYPTILVPFVVGIILILVPIVLLINLRSLRKSFLYALLGIIVGALISIPYILTGVKLLLLKQSTSGHGWELPLLDPVKLLVSSMYFHSDFSEQFRLFAWIFLILVSVFIFYFSPLKTGFKLIVSLFIFLGASGFLFRIIIMDDYLTSYQTWKSLSYIIPICLPIFLTLFNFNIGKHFLMIYLGILVPNSFFFWNQYKSDPVLNILSSEYENIQNLKFSNYTTLNIDLTSNFQTNLIPVIIPSVNLAILSQTQLGGRGEYTNSCYLINIDNEGYKYKFPINDKYAIATNNLTSCPKLN